MIKKLKNFLRPYRTRFVMAKAEKIRKRNRLNHPDFYCSSETKRCFDDKDSPFYHYELFGENTPVCCATHLHEILRDVTKVLEEHSLEYFASFGTLLGAARHGGMIPWDTDMDIIISDSDKNKILDVLRKELGDRYYITVDNEEGVVGSVIRVNYSQTNTLHLDLFVYFEKDLHLIFEQNITIRKQTIFPLKKIRFYDIDIFVPSDIWHHLKILYGDEYMDYAYKQWAMDKSKFKLTDFSPAKIEV